MDGELMPPKTRYLHLGKRWFAMLRAEHDGTADRRIRQSGPSVRADFASSLMPKPPAKSNLSLAARILHTQHSYLWLFLLLLGASCAVVSFLMDLVAGQFLLSRSKMMSAIGIRSVEAFFPWLFYSIALALIATLITKHISPAAAGSGIPEMKARLSGIVVPDLLTWKTLVAKTFGLSIAIGSGLQIGKEGPTIHIAACIASCLMEFKMFRKIRENPDSVTHMLAAACAIGVASHFGAMIGGILFSIEVTAIYYDVRNFWKGIYGSSIAGTFFYLFKRLQANTDDDAALFVQIFPSNGWIVYELGLFAILGCSCALVSVAFIRLLIKYAEWRKAKVAAKWWIFASPYAGLVQVALVTLVTCIFAYPGLISTAPYMRLSQADMIKAVLVPRKDGVQSLKAEDWGSGAILICNLFGWLVFKVLLTVFSITLPIPAGVFVPALSMGAVLGRAIGEISFLIFGADIMPSGYASVGAAAMAAAITRTISSGIIMLEVTGSMELTVPVLVAVIFAVVVGDRLSLSVFDALARFKALPYFVAMPGGSNPGSMQLRSEHAQTARELVVVDSPIIFQHSTTADLKELMSKKFDSNYVPILDNAESKIIIAVSQKLQIQDYVIRRGSNGPQSVIDRLRHKVIKDTEEINDSLLGMEMSPIEAPDHGAASSSASNDATTQGVGSAGQADAIDFYSPNRLPVDVSFMEFDPQTPPNEILLQFQRLNLLYAIVSDKEQYCGIITREALVKQFGAFMI